MRFLLDENVSPRLASAIREIAAGEPYAVDHVRNVFGAGEPDESWLARAGAMGCIVVSGDHHIRTRKHELLAWRSSGVVGFILPKWFNQSGRWEQAAFLIRWWPFLVATARSAGRGDMFEVPHGRAPHAMRPMR